MIKRELYLLCIRPFYNSRGIDDNQIICVNFEDYHNFQHLKVSAKDKGELLNEYLEWGGLPLVAR